jgi:hypothetical protein
MMARFLTTLLVSWFFGATHGVAEETAPTDAGDDPIAVVLAGHLTDTTMTAMSPLFVVSAQGAWEYFSANAADRGDLPWYTTPWLWGSLLGMGLLFTLNTAIGNAVPLLKTPMNVVEEHENKATGFLIGLPMVLTRLFPDLEVPSTVQTAATAAGTPTVMEAGLLPIAASGPWAAALIVLPIVVASYFFVWLTFHTAHVIALVSPFAIVDTALKFTRLGLVGVIAGLSFFSPILAVILCAAIILVSYFIAGWSFRLLVFGTILSWDLLLFRHRRFDPKEAQPRGFLCRHVEGAPVRSYGSFERDAEGACTFHHRPWLVMPRKSVALDSDSVSVQRGILSPILLETKMGRRRNLVRLRPCFRGHEEAVARSLKAGEVEDHAVTRGVRHAINWLKDPAASFLPAEN